MRKFLGLIAVAVLLTAAVAVNNAYAAFTSVGSSTYTAAISFTSTGTYTWSLALKNITGDASTTTITWTGVTPVTTAWKTADQYYVLATTVTATNFNIRLYTNNKSSTTAHSGGYLYTGNATMNLGGLVGKNTPTQPPLPMSWRMLEVDASSPTLSNLTNVKTYAQTAANINPEPANSMPSFILDAGNSDFATGTNPDYCKILSASGYKYGQGPADRGGSATGTRYIFFGAKFTNATTPNNYGSDTVTFEAYTE